MKRPLFPIYIVSKGRYERRQTSRALEAMRVPYFIVVEEQELEAYAAVIDRKKILVLDKKYQREYDTFDDLGLTKGPGPGPARNFAWDHSIANGAEWHWVMDDNIRMFNRFQDNLKVPVGDGTILRCMEDFCLRYSNVAMAGPNYFMFASRKGLVRTLGDPRATPVKQPPPFVLNTRIYSCNLIRNDTPFRWRGRYNEDTDLSLRMLKAGWCTVLFNAFLQYKEQTQTKKGGNTAEFYAKEGTLPKSRMQVEMHPDVSTMVWRFGRCHHYVDYRPFARNLLIRKPGVKVAKEQNDYGMKLIRLDPTAMQKKRWAGKPKPTRPNPAGEGA